MKDSDFTALIDARDFFVQNCHKYALTALPFMFNRLTIRYTPQESFKVRAVESLLFGAVAVVNEFLIDIKIVKDFSLSYLPYIASYTYKQNFYGNSVRNNIIVSMTSTLVAKLAYDMRCTTNLLDQFFTYLTLQKVGAGNIAIPVMIISLAEEYAYYGIATQSKNYASLSITCGATANYFLKDFRFPMEISFMIGGGIGLILANYKQDVLRYLFPFNTLESSYEASSVILDKTELNVEVEKLFLLSTNMYIAIGALGNTYMRQEQDLMNNYFFLAANQNNLVLQDLMNYRENIFLYIIKIAIPLLLSRILCDSLNAYYAHVFKKSLSIKFLEKILDKQRFLSVSNEAEYFSTEYIEDINILVDRIWIESSNHHDYGIVNDIAYIIPKLYFAISNRKSNSMREFSDH